MGDNLTPEQRRRCMAGSRGKDTKPEILLRSYLHRRGLRFRKNLKGLPGTPDIAFVGAKVAVFVDGDFWHGRELDEDMARGRFSANRDFWAAKLKRNVERDRQVDLALATQGWKVLRFWESDVKAGASEIADTIANELRDIPNSSINKSD